MLPTKVFKQRQFIYNEEETANEMYIIKNGKVRIVRNIKNNPITVSTLDKGSFFGEVALLREQKHSATAVAETDVELIVINKESFNQQLGLLQKWFQTIIRSMAERLNSTLDQLSKLQPSTPVSTIGKTEPEKPEPEKQVSEKQVSEKSVPLQEKKEE